MRLLLLLVFLKSARDGHALLVAQHGALSLPRFRLHGNPRAQFGSVALGDTTNRARSSLVGLLAHRRHVGEPTLSHVLLRRLLVLVFWCLKESRLLPLFKFGAGLSVDLLSKLLGLGRPGLLLVPRGNHLLDRALVFLRLLAQICERVLLLLVFLKSARDGHALLVAQHGALSLPRFRLHGNPRAQFGSVALGNTTNRARSSLVGLLALRRHVGEPTLSHVLLRRLLVLVFWCLKESRLLPLFKCGAGLSVDLLS